jgi:seryl-tRNA synthetase
MIDLAELRKNPEIFKQQILKKDPSYDILGLIQLDEKHRHLALSVEALRKEKNDLSKSFSGKVTEEFRQKSINVGKDLKEKEQELEVVEKQFHDLYLSCPNPMESAVPA